MVSNSPVQSAVSAGEHLMPQAEGCLMQKDTASMQACSYVAGRERHSLCIAAGASMCQWRSMWDT